MCHRRVLGGRAQRRKSEVGKLIRWRWVRLEYWARAMSQKEVDISMRGLCRRHGRLELVDVRKSTVNIYLWMAGRWQRHVRRQC